MAKPQKSLLVMDAAAPQMGALATRLREMGYRSVCAKTIEEATRLVEDAPELAAALIPPELADASIPDDLVELRSSAHNEGLEYVVAGARPKATVVDRLRAAGVELALWEPITDGGLRFQVNRALAGAGGSWPRGSLRVPTDWKPGFEVAGRRKEGAVYSLSESGVFLTTQRPSMARAEIELCLPLPGKDLIVAGRVVYANITGNLVKPNLPMGMAVQFKDLAPEDAALLRAYVEKVAASYTL
jgi:hypothetical protein